jgi:hypothetical protein
MDWLRADCQERLSSFLADDTQERLAFDPLGERGNYVVVEEVSEHPGLIDQTEGEMLDERHVAVYKKDRLPKDVAIRLGMYVRSAAEEAEVQAELLREEEQFHNSRKATAAAGLALPPPEIVVAKTEDRDRRTVGEILKATEKTKRARLALLPP